jgi:streptolysin S family bacteriocin protoxin
MDDRFEAWTEEQAGLGEGDLMSMQSFGLDIILEAETDTVSAILVTVGSACCCSTTTKVRVGNIGGTSDHIRCDQRRRHKNMALTSRTSKLKFGHGGTVADCG